MMGQRAPITYRDFYDVPRVFLVSHAGSQFLFDCKFDDDLDEYPDIYKVFLMPSVEELELGGSWDDLSRFATKYLGEVPVSVIDFDESRRSTIHSEVLEDLLRRKAA